MSNTLDPEQGDALKRAWLNLPQDAQQAMINVVFVPELINFLGFDPTERVPEYSTGKGGDKVDYALRHNREEDIFIQTKNNPQILLELKGRDINLQENSPKYKSTVKQLKGYLLAPNCRSVQWGIITNSNQIQLFRKHGKVIYPATPCLEINQDNICATLKVIKDKIDQTKKGLTVAIYNNKGGVGKTTTVANLAAALAIKGKKVLIVDFDANQRDLTNLLKAQVGQQTLYDCLASKNQINSSQVIYPHRIKNKQGNQEIRFDIIPVDPQLSNMGEDNLRQNFSFRRLGQVLDSFKSNYDYILIDSPPNWRFFSVSAVYAADVVLIPTKHNNLFSLENAAVAIKDYITETQETKQDGSPIALPIFFNGEKITDAQRRTVHQAIDNLISRYKKEYAFDLSPYFYPRWTRGKRDRFIFEIPSHAVIADAAFGHIPSVYKNKIARDYYMNLAKEYFLQ